MTDDVMKDLVTKHDATITQLVSSVEHLVRSQTTTNERLEEISKFLAKQVVFSSKLETMDKDISDSFSRRDQSKLDSDKRIHRRIDEIETTQKSDNGCNSVRLLTKDIESLTKDVTRLIAHDAERSTSLEELDKKVDKYPSNKVIITISTVVIGYMIIFGTYVVQSLNKFDTTTAKLSVMLDRDMADISKLMEVRK